MRVGAANFAWVSDYSQFYLIDAEDQDMRWVEDVPTEAFEQNFYVAPKAIAIYTVDCLRQVIQITQFDSAPDVAPTELMSEMSWTKMVETKVTFPSGKFLLTSPSAANGERYGAHFNAIAKTVNVRIQWLEISDERYDAFRPRPDVISVSLWPAV